ncbi:MAG: DUF1080 domain-containing protein [Bacteroidetes bacterium]|nr:DUF1080 domain-containing protein [Fibrella sp.]
MSLSRLTVALLAVGLTWVVGTGPTLAQSSSLTSLPLSDLSAFRGVTASTVAPNWRIVSDVMADVNQKDALTTKPGTGILANQPAKPEYGRQFNLLTTLEHGDLDLELDYMMAKGANSGVYLQGRYEVQLFDSWGVKTAGIHDNGAIYERWNDAKPEGQKGYEGHPARQNATRAPGLWQHLKIAFQAPRFDASGKKTENARMLSVELNGVLIHENVELLGPTRGPLADDEVPRGPLLFQGDHGPVAFKNIRYTSYNKPRPELVDLNYSVYKGKFATEPDFAKVPPEAKGSSNELTTGVSRIPTTFTIRYTGTLRVKEPGSYTANLSVPGGASTLRINNQPVLERAERNKTGSVVLPAGELPFELLYTKLEDWVRPTLGLTLSGPGVRAFSLTSLNAPEGSEETDPILIDANVQPILRSFMDVPGMEVPSMEVSGAAGTTASGSLRRREKPFRVVHAISVGSPDQVHYTYDMDNGALVQVWRGTFLDATPMWHDRGDGSSRPTGMVQRMGLPRLTLEKLASPGAAWQVDTVGSGYRPRGYVLDNNDRPTFNYLLYGSPVEDAIRVLEGGHGIRRELRVKNPSPSANLYARLCEGSSIETMPNGMYLIDGKSYYVRVDEAAGATPVVRTVGGRQELIVPVKEKLIYSILF